MHSGDNWTYYDDCPCPRNYAGTIEGRPITWFSTLIEGIVQSHPCQYRKNSAAQSNDCFPAANLGMRAMGLAVVLLV